MNHVLDYVTVLLKDGLGGRRQARLPVPQADLNSLTLNVRQAFQPELDCQEFFLTTGSARVVDTDIAARKLRPGDQLQVCLGNPGSQMPSGTVSTGRGKPPLGASRLASSITQGGVQNSSRKNLSLGSAFKAPSKERISFVPHPKTLTMAGDYEYFSARGHHPFAFALAELVDNSLRATKAQAARADKPRIITVSLIVNERGSAGLIRVQDNGRGMSPKELGEWAVMNLSMEDRGLLPSAGQRASGQAGGGRYLSGDLSFFGVGSKNSAFFMGSTVKLATRQAGSEYVHELNIAGAELERRYKCGENVYEEDMVHREPGDDSTLSQEESAFGVPRAWLAEEASAASFTRVSIFDLRADVLSLVRDSDSGAMVCRDLAHLYHYYLHGPAGNVAADAAPRAAGDAVPGFLPGGEVMPAIAVEYLVGSRQIWRRQLAEVDDDLESRYVRAAKAKMEFELDVPGKGTVEGVLWYFPFTDGAETAPRELGAAAYGAGGQAGGAAGSLAQELPTQMTLHGAAALATQLARGARGATGSTQGGDLPEQMQRALADMLLEEEDLGDDQARAQGHVPIFETFWQGRLIPGSGLDCLPFIEALRSKMRGSSSGKDYLPDDVFRRIRGALFFGPAWRVTRNKLTFRDPLQELLATATPSDRALDKRLREWLRDCHTRLDRILQFQGPVDVDVKALVRKELGEGMTGFTRVADGTRTISAGDIVRLSTKPAALGRVKYFAVPQAGATEGTYATGFVTFSGLPAFLHGPRHMATLNLRRVEEVVSPAAMEDFTSRERAKLPSSLRLEPLRFASGRRVDVEVGEVLPETTVTICNAAGHRLTRVFLQGQKVALRVRQRLIFLGPRRPSAYCSGLSASAAGDEEQAERLEEQLEPPAGTEAVAAAENADAGPVVKPAVDGLTDVVTSGPPAAAAAEAGGKKGRKRRKKNGPAADTADDGQGLAAAAGAAGKENQAPHNEQGATKRPRRESACGSGGNTGPGGAAAAVTVSHAGAAGPLPEGVGEVVLIVENKTPVDSVFQFSKITGGLTRSGTYFLEHCMLPDLPPGCDQSGGPVTIWSRTVFYATAGPPLRFELRGEARAVLATKAIALGETLPPLQLVCYDAQDNEVALVPVSGAGPSGVAVELEPTGEGTSDGACGAEALDELREVHLGWQTVSTAEALVLQDLRLTGGRPHSRGMRLFGGAGRCDGPPTSLQSFDRTPAGGQSSARPAAVPEVGLQLRISLPGMPSQVLPFKLRAGPPAALRLLPGNPFQADAGEPADAAHPPALQPVAVMNGEALPEFQVLALDSWGNCTGPSSDLSAGVELEGPMLQPSPAPFDIDTQGVATVQGVRVVAPDSSHIGVVQDVRLSIRCTSRGSGPRAALELAQASVAEAEAAVAAGSAGASSGPVGWSCLHLPLVVQPCTLPAGLQLLYQGEPCEVGPSASGEGLAAVLRNVPAGSQLSCLTLAFLDEGGRPAEPGFRGKLQVSWSRGSKKVKVTDEGSRLELPPLAVREQAGTEPQSAWIRFVGDGPLLSGMTLETSLEVLVVAGAAASWGVSLVESGAAANGGGAGAVGTSQVTENLGFVACGAALCLEIEAHDAHGNRCSTWTGPGQRPTPVVIPTREQGDAPLLYDTTEWVCGWDLSQQSACEVYRVRLALGGSVGPVKLVVRDSQGPGGESMLQPDELPVELHAGPPTALAFDGPQQLQCGTRGCLGELRVRVSDDWGNLVESIAVTGRGNKDQGAGLELTLQSSAIAMDGSGNAAKVAVAGSNKAQVTKGCACFRDVKLEGVPGTYAIRVGSASRKVALREAMLTVEVVAQNLVCHVAIAPCSLPEEPLEPGTHLELQVEVTTEDDRPLTLDVATAGLCLRVKAPSAEAAAAARGDKDAAAAAAAAAAANGVAGGSSAAACSLVLQPQPPDPEASQSSRLLWTFVTPGPLLVAGTYSVTAEYVELRPDLARALSKAEQSVRSVSHAMELLPGPPVRASLERDPRAAAATAAGPITITNGSDGCGRTLLSSAAVQLRDEHGNPVALDGVAVRWVLGWSGDEEAAEGAGCDGEPGPPPRSAVASGAELPALQGAGNEAPSVVEALTDARGRAFFRELSVVEGTGSVGSAHRGSGGGDDAGQALHLELRLLVALSAGGGLSPDDNGGWLCCWSAPVVFSDDAARAATLQRLCARRDELAAAVARQEEAKGAADRALDAAQRVVRQARTEVEQVMRRAGPGASAAAPQSCVEAQELLHRLRGQHQRATSSSQQRRDALPARYGPSTSGVVMALNRCLAVPEGQGEVVGVIAQLATVDNPRLSALLSAAFSSTLQILVVQTYECIKRLREMLTANRNQLPSMLAINMVQGFTCDGGRQATEMAMSMRCVSQEAQELQAAACEGADPALPMLLPHTRMLMAANPDRVRAVAGAGPAASEWPHGCLGYAVNLIRPIASGHRATIFYSQLGRTLVFETLDQAAAYRTYVVQTLGCAGLGDIYTLDGGKLSGRGVVVGSGFRVLPLEDAVVRFGAAQSSQSALAKQLSQQVSDLEALAAALEAAEGATAAEAVAQEQADAAAQELDAVRAGAEDELQQLEREIAALAGNQPHAGGSGGSGGRGKGGRGSKRSRNAAAATGTVGDEPGAPPPDPGPGQAAEQGGEPQTQAGAVGTRGQRSKRARGQGRMAAMQ